MSEHTKITAAHLRRHAVVYVRQSTPGQVQANRESTARQYALTDRAVALGWPADAVRIIDEDLGVSGASVTGRAGFQDSWHRRDRPVARIGRYRAQIGRC